MAHRPTSSALVSAVAECQRCAWSVSGNNALALGARHFDHHGHRVRVTTTTEITYGALSGSVSKSEKQGNLAL
jgi:hypothetical protein